MSASAARLPISDGPLSPSQDAYDGRPDAKSARLKGERVSEVGKRGKGRERPVLGLAGSRRAGGRSPTSGHPGWRSKLPVTAIRSAHRSRFKVAHMPRTAGLTAAVP